MPNGIDGSPIYCTNPRHTGKKHDVNCIPPADPTIPELRLVRAIYGLCPDCDNPWPHIHIQTRRQRRAAILGLMRNIVLRITGGIVAAIGIGALIVFLLLLFGFMIYLGLSVSQ